MATRNKSISSCQLGMVWLVVAVAMLIAKPWGEFYWDEWVALATPVLFLHARVRRFDALIIGLAASGMAWFLLSTQSGGWLELACLWAVVVGGIIFGFAALRGDHVGWSYDRTSRRLSNENVFLDTLERELCRTRREEGSLAVLSVAWNTDNATNSLHEACKFLNTQLRAYADIAQVDGRVLALIPNTKESDCAPLLRRLLAKSERYHDGGLEFGLAHFPSDEICTAELIKTADRKRVVKGVSEASTDIAGEEGQGHMAV